MDVREVANYLLNHCFLPSQAEDLREKHYYAVNHLEELRRIFKPLGYTVVYHSAPLKVIALISEYEGNQAKLNKYESILLLIFRLLYLQKREKLSLDGEHVVVTVGELQEEYQKLGLPRKLDRSRWKPSCGPSRPTIWQGRWTVSPRKRPKSRSIPLLFWRCRTMS